MANRTLCCPIRSVKIILVIKQIGFLLRGLPILIITCMITDRIGLHSVLLPLLIFMNVNTPFIIINIIYDSNYSSQSNMSEVFTVLINTIN